MKRIGAEARWNSPSARADLVRELSLSQGVVEKKTTIPILSNVLLEAAGDRDHADRDGPGIGHPLFLPGAGEEGRLGHGSGAASCWITCACCRKATST